MTRCARLPCHVALDILDRECRTGERSVHAALVDGFHERQRYLVDAFDHECDNDEWLEFRGQRLAKVRHTMPFDLDSRAVLVVCTRRRIA